jgi:hypothetical protein
MEKCEALKALVAVAHACMPQQAQALMDLNRHDHRFRFVGRVDACGCLDERELMGHCGGWGQELRR